MCAFSYSRHAVQMFDRFSLLCYLSDAPYSSGGFKGGWVRAVRAAAPPYWLKNL